MDEFNLEAQIEIVLNKEYDDLENGLRSYKLISQRSAKFIDYPHADTLIDIFSNIQNDSKLKEKFFELLAVRILKSKDAEFFTQIGRVWASKVPISIYTLIKIGFTKEVVSLIVGRGELPSVSLLHLLELLLKIDEETFDVTMLNKISKALNRMNYQKMSTLAGEREFNECRKRLQSLILNQGYKKVKDEVKGINLEINQDKKAVSEKVLFLGFDSKYTDLLNEIDKYLNTETSNVLNSGMINNLRVFMNDIVIDIANNLAKYNKTEIPKLGGTTPIGNARNYLKNELKLTDNEHKFINTFIDILHAQGGHAFTSNKEYFRLSRNIAIEIILLLLSKYEKIISK